MALNPKKKDALDEQHVDDWLMTYADMITLLLCFFAIILSVSIIKQDELEAAKREMAKQFASDGLARGDSATEEAQRPGIHADIDGGTRYDGQRGQSDQRGAQQNFQSRMDIDESDRITIIELDSSLLFPSGSATLSQAGMNVLAELLPTLHGPKYHNYTITVEGHTDNIPINTPAFPSNWELSTSRAAGVVRFFIAQGISPHKLRATGYGDASPKVPNEDSFGRPIPTNQAQNRRVVVKLERVEGGGF